MKRIAAVLVIASRDTAPPDCAATVISRDDWRQHGALSLRRTEGGFTIDAARPADYDRPRSRRRCGEPRDLPLPLSFVALLLAMTSLTDLLRCLAAAVASRGAPPQ